MDGEQNSDLYCLSGLVRGFLTRVKIVSPVGPSIIGTTKMTKTAPVTTAKSFATARIGKNRDPKQLTLGLALTESSQNAKIRCARYQSQEDSGG